MEQMNFPQGGRERVLLTEKLKEFFKTDSSELLVEACRLSK